MTSQSTLLRVRRRKGFSYPAGPRGWDVLVGDQEFRRVERRGRQTALRRQGRLDPKARCRTL